MDIGDMIGIMTALLFICIICFGLNYDAKDHPVKPKRKKHYREPVDKADETDMYGNWMYPDLHREKEDRELQKGLNDMMR